MVRKKENDLQSPQLLAGLEDDFNSSESSQETKASSTPHEVAKVKPVAQDKASSLDQTSATVACTTTTGAEASAAATGADASATASAAGAGASTAGAAGAGASIAGDAAGASALVVESFGESVDSAEALAAKKPHRKKATQKLDLMDFKLCQPSLIEASAGTGKTYTITNLVLRALLGSGSAEKGLGRPLRIEDMLIVTFTNAATADLRLRIYERIRLARSSFEIFLNRVMTQCVVALQDMLDDGSLTKSIKAALKSADEASLVNDPNHLQAIGISDVKNSPKGKLLKRKKKQIIATKQQAAVQIELEAKRLYQKMAHETINVDDMVEKDFWQELINVKNYEDEELKVLLANINVAEIMKGTQADFVIIKLIEELLYRDPKLIRQAIIVLTKAERNINASAICTIHSFCNSALTQIYALESGEAFNTEIKIDLDYETHEACFAVWRRLFYKKNSSNILLKQLKYNDPLTIFSKSSLLNSVRLSNDADGLWGYQLRGFKHLIETCELDIDVTDDVERQLIKVAEDLEKARFKNNKQIVSAFIDLCKNMSYQDFGQYLDLRNNEFGPKILDAGKAALNTREGNKIKLLAKCYVNFAYFILVSSLLSKRLESQGLQDIDPALTEELKALSSITDTVDLKGILTDETIFFTSKSLNVEPPVSFIDHEALAEFKQASSRGSGTKEDGDDYGPEIILPDLAPKLDDEEPSLDKDVTFGVYTEHDKAEDTTLQLMDIKVEYDKYYRDFLSSLSDFIDAVSKIKEATTIHKKTVKVTPEVLALIEEFKGIIISIGEKFGNLVDETNLFESESAALLRTMASMAIAFELDRHCREHRIMSNDDLLRRLDNALNSNGEISERLARLVRIRYPLAMIDEFQDTDPVQYNIFSKVYLNQSAVDEKAYCYLIGDPKQSIYAFRGSDINSYLKAKQAIEKLTHGKGIYTLDTNYRSYDDVVQANNAIFNRRLNTHNFQPFDVKNINFEDVKSAKKLDPVHGSPFKINGITNFIQTKAEFEAKNAEREAKKAEEEAKKSAGKGSKAKAAPESETASPSPSSSSSSSTAEILGNSANQGNGTNTGINNVSEATSQQGAGADASRLDQYSDLFANKVANTYVINVGEAYTNSTALFSAYAKTTAQMIYRVLQDGHINGTKVRSGDIAVLVRNYSESDLIQAELRAIDLQSVYYSDKTSVLTRVLTRNFASSSVQYEPSVESTELCYLMEAMCACTDRRKVMRLLGSNLLNLSSQEFILRSQGENFEKEVQCLSKCAKIWNFYGFMPAFLQWVNDPIHNVCARILSTDNGERLFTNYCHIGEIIQSVHGKKGGIDSQLRWFYDLISNREELLESDMSQKRLESEHDQIKIMTLHKSKGLEFPVVFMPFLWSYRRKSNYKDDYYYAVKYYDSQKYHHQVLDFNTSRMVSDESGFVLNPDEVAQRDVEREQTRLLYVAITRAKLANFYCVGDCKKNSFMEPSALARMHGVDYSFTAPVEDDTETTKASSSSSAGCDYKCFVNAALDNPDLFTVLDGDKCVADLLEVKAKLHPESSLDDVENGDAHIYSLSDGSAFSNKGKSEKHDLTNDQNISKVDINNLPACAMSFLYKNAIDRTFNILSYSSLVSGQHGKQNLSSPVEKDDNRFEDGSTDNVQDTAIARTQDESTMSKDEVTSEYSYKDSRVSISAFMQEEWQSQYKYKDRVRERAVSKICHEFPRGATYGTLLHECLQVVLFDQIKDLNFYQYVALTLMPTFEMRPDYVNMSHVFKKDPNELREGYLDWLQDIVEAPIVQGKYHCFALSDLKSRSFEPEMDFLMSNSRFNTTKIDEICSDIAESMLPPHLAHLGHNLHIKEDTLVGFVTGSIDLACRFNLNERLDLRRRADLFSNITQDYCSIIYRNLENMEKQGLLDEENMLIANQEEEDVKYYVIDYKSNHLGDDDSCYTYDNLVTSIYQHRYDLQFLIYSLAIYRLLKRRMGISFEASYEECEAFYNKHIGGVIYLFLRGMKANFNRDAISNGVFTTKIDFEFIYRLDRIFTEDLVEDEEEQE